jgi:hypothetical protein
MTDRDFLTAMHIDPDSAPKADARLAVQEASSEDIAKAITHRIEQPEIERNWRDAAIRWREEAQEMDRENSELRLKLESADAKVCVLENAVTIFAGLLMIAAIIAAASL